MLPTARLSDAVRQLKVGKVRGKGFNRAEVLAARGKPAVCITIDARLGLFDAVLLNEWDSVDGCYGSSTNIYDDMITSNNWRVVAAWIKDKLS